VSASRHRKEVDALLWAVPEHPLSVECPWFILDEIHGSVQEGFRRLSRGGVEVGGVLFGRKTGNVVRILAWRPILCEHSRGPAFLLSNNDKQKLVEQLEAAGRDPHLQVLEPVGWFVSHTRAGLTMTEDDVETFQRYFPGSWHVTLVYNPGRQGPTRAGFFVRDSSGRVLSESTYREFAVTNVRVPKPEAAPSSLATQAPGSHSAATAGLLSWRRPCSLARSLYLQCPACERLLFLPNLCNSNSSTHKGSFVSNGIAPAAFCSKPIRPHWSSPMGRPFLRFLSTRKRSPRDR
jgi:proteasome lid subunit RPN8/RPN11